MVLTNLQSLNYFELRCSQIRLILPPSVKECNYGLRATKNDSCLTKFLVNDIHIYGSK